MSVFTNKSAGFSLIEVLVTFLVLSIGLLGLAGLQSTSIKQGLDSGQRSQAAWLIQELVERMRANKDGLASGYTNATGNNNLCDDGPAKICSDHLDDGTKTNAATNCTANEMAEFDVWELTCGFTRANTVSGAAEQLLLSGDGLTLSCVDIDTTDADPCTTGSDFTATLNWTSLAAEAATSNESEAKSIAYTIRP